MWTEIRLGGGWNFQVHGIGHQDNVDISFSIEQFNKTKDIGSIASNIVYFRTSEKKVMEQFLKELEMAVKKAREHMNKKNPLLTSYECKICNKVPLIKEEQEAIAVK